MTLIDGVTNAGVVPVLQRAMQFAGARHRILGHNIANISTPNYRPVDLSVEEFQTAIGEAIDRQRAAGPAGRGPLEIDDTQQLEFSAHGLRTSPQPAGDNILFHDGNDRDLERTMQALAENFMTFRFAAEMFRSRFAMIDTAIRGRI